MAFNFKIEDLDNDLNECGKIRKGTNRGRMEKADKVILDYFLHEQKKDVVFLDIAASTCITTLDLHNRFIDSGIKINTTATDLVLYLYHIPVGLFNVVVDKNGYVFQYYLGRYLIRFPYRRLFIYLGFGMLYKWLDSQIRKNKKEIKKYQRISLVDESAKKTRNFTYIEDDVTILNNSLINRFDFIRVAHCLDMLIDDEHAFNSAIVNIKQYLNGKGSHLLVLSQEENGTLFECDGSGNLNISLRVGKGYKFETKILDV